MVIKSKGGEIMLVLDSDKLREWVIEQCSDAKLNYARTIKENDLLSFITSNTCFYLILLNGIWLEARKIRDGGKRDE